MKQNDISTNPIIQKLREQNPSGIIELQGYLETVNNETVRIYRDLSLERYVEILSDSILHRSESAQPNGPDTILFNSTAQLTYVQTVKVSTSTSLTQSLNVPASTVRQTAQGRTTPSVLTRDSTSISRFAADNDDGPEFPSLQCELTCEVALNQCLAFDITCPTWCWIDHYVCLLGCITREPSGGVIVRV